jgi:hypothetical protein
MIYLLNYSICWFPQGYSYFCILSFWICAPTKDERVNELWRLQWTHGKNKRNWVVAVCQHSIVGCCLGIVEMMWGRGLFYLFKTSVKHRKNDAFEVVFPKIIF